MRKNLSSILVILTLIILTFAQTNSVNQTSIKFSKLSLEWSKSFGREKGISQIRAFNTLVDNEGNLYIFSTSIPPLRSVTALPKIILYKISRSGKVEFVKYFSVRYSFPEGAIVIEGFDKENYLYLLSSVIDFGGTNQTYIYLTKLNEDGEVVYSKTIKVNKILAVYRGVVDENGNSYILALGADLNKIYISWTVDLYLIKMDSSGNILEEKKIFEKKELESAWIALDGSNNIYLAYTLTVEGYWKSYVIKLDDSLNMQFNKSISDEYKNKIRIFKVDKFGNIYMLVRMYTEFTSWSYLIRWKSDGSEVYKVHAELFIDDITYDSNQYLYLLSTEGGVSIFKVSPTGSFLLFKGVKMISDAENSYIFFGFIRSTNWDDFMVVANFMYSHKNYSSFSILFSVAKVNSDLELDWYKEIWGSQEDTVIKLEADALGNIYFNTYVANLSGYFIQLYKMDSKGKILWNKTLSIKYLYNDFTVDKWGNIFIKYLSVCSSMYLIEKRSTDGKIVWRKSFPANISIITGIFRGFESLDTDEDGNVYSLQPILKIISNEYHYGFEIVKLDSDGNIVFDKAVIDESDAILLPRGISVYGGYTYVIAIRISYESLMFPIPSYEPIIYKFSPTGDLILNKTILYEKPMMLIDIKSSSNGSIFVLGIIADPLEPKISLYKFNENLEIISMKKIGFGENLAIPYDMDIGEDGVYIAGTYIENWSNNILWKEDGFLLKMDLNLENGEFLRFDKGGLETIYNVAISKDKVFVSGYYEKSPGDIDGFVGKVGKPSIIIEPAIYFALPTIIIIAIIGVMIYYRRRKQYVVIE